MSDLIRRKDVLALFPTNDYSDKMVGLYERVLDIPTAYDKEAVVEAIHNLRLDDTAHCDETTRYGGCDNFGSCAECVLARVEDWVKAGGIDG